MELGLGACFRASKVVAPIANRRKTDTSAIGAVVFGSDQGLVGQFNDVVTDFALKTLSALPGKLKVWAVGEGVQARLTDAGLKSLGIFAVPNSVQAITPLVGQIQIESEARRAKGEYTQLYIFHNRPKSEMLPEVLCSDTVTLRALIREYLFISLFRACAESLASENASRLAAMERADKNIDELLDTLHSKDSASG